jgi:Phosphotransferase enzyme family
LRICACSLRLHGLRDLAREAATLLRALHSWPVPEDLAEMLRRPGEDPDPLRRAGSELVPLPPSSVLGLIPLASQLPFVDNGVLDAAAERLRELGNPMTADGEVLLHGDFYLVNVLVHGDHVSALIDLEFSRMGPRDLELISVVRALDAETRLGLQRPPLLAWLAADYPELFGPADLHRRLWLYAIAYTIRQIIFWPPDRAEADDLEVTHPLPGRAGSSGWKTRRAGRQDHLRPAGRSALGTGVKPWLQGRPLASAPVGWAGRRYTRGPHEHRPRRWRMFGPTRRRSRISNSPRPPFRRHLRFSSRLPSCRF